MKSRSPIAAVPFALAYALSFAIACAISFAGPSAAQDSPAPSVSRGIYLVREFRNPTLAAAASMVVPGGGQIYNDDLAKFLLALAGLGGSAGLFLSSQDATLRAVSGTTFGLVWLWSIGDAYLAASLYNSRLEQQALR